MADQSGETSEAPAGGASSGWSTPLLVVLMVLVGALLLRPGRGGGAGDHTPQPLPPMAVEGWLNADAAPTLEGKIVVLDAWFTTCPPCLRSLPKLARLHEEFGGDQRVQFIGLTFEPEANLPQIESVIDRTDGFVWPVAYGARPPLEMLDISRFPTLMVFDQTGTSIWRGHDLGELELLLERIL